MVLSMADVRLIYWLLLPCTAAVPLIPIASITLRSNQSLHSHKHRRLRAAASVTSPPALTVTVKIREIVKASSGGPFDVI